MHELILVIDDEPGIVDFLERGLRTHGFEVISAFDGVSGTEMALEQDVNLVVLDMMLPKRGGLEVMAELQQAKPALPVIVLTALDEARRRAIGAEWAAADVMTKPFSLAALAARVRAQIDLVARVRVELS